MTMAPELTGTTWEAELSRMEADVEAARTLLTAPTGDTGDDAPTTDAHEAYLAELDAAGWTPPTDLGALPEHLLPRAVSVVAAQQELVDALGRALATITRQRSFAAKVTGATVTPAAPAYLDVTA